MRLETAEVLEDKAISVANGDGFNHMIKWVLD